MTAPWPRHAPTQAAQADDGRPLPLGSGLDLHVHFARLADIHSSLADEYREMEDIQLAACGERALMSGMIPGRLLSVRNLADFLDVDEKTVRRWREAGKLPPALEISGVVRWRPEDIDAWLEEQCG